MKNSFSDLRLHERKNLQNDCQRTNGSYEELLIIQKEFADWEDTNERLDLLALDKQGSLVIIENKLDDSGKDVTWQALEHASYCSTLSKENIKKIYQDYLGPKEKAEEKLSEFFDDTDTTYEELSFITQRIILIAARFRKEVTSTVLWLMRFKIKIQCFRATPYSMDINGDKKLFLNFEQIIPPKDAEDYMIRMAEKEQDISASQNHLEVVSHAKLEELIQ
ncbi:MAG: PD-(D/E)XK nuclease family protein [Candidatus Porifericomitaceae bacterium WSBS_2022_MAG_OTU9]